MNSTNTKTDKACVAGLSQNNHSRSLSMKGIFTKLFLLVFAVLLLGFISGCEFMSPMDAVNERVDENEDGIADNDDAIADLEERVAALEDFRADFFELAEAIENDEIPSGDISPELLALYDAVGDFLADTFSRYVTIEDFNAVLFGVDDGDNDDMDGVMEMLEDARERLAEVEMDLETKITLAESESETYRILFGDIAINEDGTLKNYYRNKMYWNEHFQGYTRFVNSLLYQIASGIRHEGYTPNEHAANSVVEALREYYVTKSELDIEVSALEDQIEDLDALHDALRDEFDVVAGDYLKMADYMILVDMINTLRSDMDDALATKLSVYTFRYNRNMIYESLADLASIGDGWVPFEFKLHSSISSVSNVSIVTNSGDYVHVNNASDSDPLTFELYHRDDYYWSHYDILGSTVNITVTVPGVGTTTLEDVPVYKLLLDGTGVYPQLRIYDGGSYQSLILDSQFGTQAERF